MTEWKRQLEIYLLQTLHIQIQLKRMTINLNGWAESEYIGRHNIEFQFICVHKLWMLNVNLWNVFVKMRPTSATINEKSDLMVYRIQRQTTASNRIYEKRESLWFRNKLNNYYIIRRTMTPKLLKFLIIIIFPLFSSPPLSVSFLSAFPPLFMSHSFSVPFHCYLKAI